RDRRQRPLGCGRDRTRAALVRVSERTTGPRLRNPPRGHGARSWLRAGGDDAVGIRNACVEHVRTAAHRALGSHAPSLLGAHDEDAPGIAEYAGAGGGQWVLKKGEEGNRLAKSQRGEKRAK